MISLLKLLHCAIRNQKNHVFHEVGILGIGRISEETQVISENLTSRKICFFNLTFDHRVVDGFPAAKFLESIEKNIQNPQSLVEK